MIEEKPAIVELIHWYKTLLTNFLTRFGCVHKLWLEEQQRRVANARKHRR